MTEATVLEPEVIPPDVTRKAETQALAERYNSQADADLALAKSTRVTSDEEYVYAGELRLRIDGDRKRAEVNEEIVCKPLWDHWKFLKGLFKPSIEKRVEACNLLSRERLEYDKKKQAEADRIRREQEAVARREQDRLDRLADEKAKRAEAKGDTERAEEIRQTVPQVPLPIPFTGSGLPKTAGIAKQTYWFAEVEGCDGLDYAKAVKHQGLSRERIQKSFLSLVTAVAAGEVPLEALLPNESWLGITVKGLMHNMKYPGVRVWSEERERGTGR